MTFMAEELDDDIRATWTLQRGSGIAKTRFHLAAEVISEFVEPTRDEVRTALMQILDEALGPDPVELEIAGWTADLPETSELLYTETEEIDFNELTPQERYEILANLLEVLPPGGSELMNQHGWIKVT